MSDLKVDGITAATANTAVTIKGLGTGKVVLGDGNLVFPDADGAAGTFITTNGSAALSFATAGKVVQVVNVMNGAVATGTTQIPADDTIPQKTEGDEYMTLAITPSNASNKLIIDVVASIGNNSANSSNTVALFQDSTANALAVSLNMETGAQFVKNIKFTHFMAAGTTSATTFKVRAGSNQTATTTFNGRNSGRFFGGVFASSITITEISA